MKHLPFNHHWQYLGAAYGTAPTDYMFSRYKTTTHVNLFCKCGKTRTKKIADYQMSPSDIARYALVVYP